jgi:ribosomal protein S21
MATSGKCPAENRLPGCLATGESMKAHRHQPTPAERQKRAVASEIADKAFAAFVAVLPTDPQTRRYACERMTRLTGAQVAVDHGEAAALRAFRSRCRRRACVQDGEGGG